MHFAISDYNIGFDRMNSQTIELFVVVQGFLHSRFNFKNHSKFQHTVVLAMLILSLQFHKLMFDSLPPVSIKSEFFSEKKYDTR